MSDSIADGVVFIYGDPRDPVREKKWKDDE
jgi:hypothetical protein